MARRNGLHEDPRSAQSLVHCKRLQIRQLERVGELTLADLQRAADARGEIDIRIRWAGQERTVHGGVETNPGWDQHLALNTNDALIVLTTHEPAGEPLRRLGRVA